MEHPPSGYNSSTGLVRSQQQQTSHVITLRLSWKADGYRLGDLDREEDVEDAGDAEDVEDVEDAEDSEDAEDRLDIVVEVMCDETTAGHGLRNWSGGSTTVRGDGLSAMFAEVTAGRARYRMSVR